LFIGLHRTIVFEDEESATKRALTAGDSKDETTTNADIRQVTKCQHAKAPILQEKLSEVCAQCNGSEIAGNTPCQFM